jgi:hypothetical protein
MIVAHKAMQVPAGPAAGFSVTMCACRASARLPPDRSERHRHWCADGMCQVQRLLQPRKAEHSASGGVDTSMSASRRSRPSAPAATSFAATRSGARGGARERRPRDGRVHGLPRPGARHFRAAARMGGQRRRRLRDFLRQYRGRAGRHGDCPAFAAAGTRTMRRRVKEESPMAAPAVARAAGAHERFAEAGPHGTAPRSPARVEPKRSSIIPAESAAASRTRRRRTAVPVRPMQLIGTPMARF